MSKCLRCGAGAEWLEGEVPAKDPGCICEGNWRNIIAETTPYLGKYFKDSDGQKWYFFGVIWGEDDLYYGMHGKSFAVQGKLKMLSCVGSLEGHGYKLIEDAPKSKLNRQRLRELFQHTVFKIKTMADRKGKFYISLDLTEDRSKNGHEAWKRAEWKLREIWPYATMTSGGTREATFRLNPDEVMRKHILEWDYKGKLPHGQKDTEQVDTTR